MTDTPARIQAIVDARFASMTPDERVAIAISMNRTGRAIVLSSLPEDVSEEERRRLLCRRLYGALADRAFGR